MRGSPGGITYLVGEVRLSGSELVYGPIRKEKVEAKPPAGLTQGRSVGAVLGPNLYLVVPGATVAADHVATVLRAANVEPAPQFTLVSPGIPWSRYFSTSP